MSLVGRRAFALLALCGCAAVSGCLSPTLPLPPPAEPEVERVEPGVYRLSGVIPDPGMVQAMNLRTREIFGLATSREYSFRVYAEPRDTIQLWYSTGKELSEPLFFQIDPQGALEPDASSGSDASTDADADR